MNILGVGVSAVSMDVAVRRTLQFLRNKTFGYICVTGVHGIMEAQADEAFRRILNGSFLTTPDGMPTVWLGKAAGHRSMTRVYGPDFMLEVCRAGVSQGVRHYLYGGREGVADALKQALVEQIPGLQIAGASTPPFRPLTQQDETELAALLRSTETDVLWVGLSTPKQERFMSKYHNLLGVNLMVGVGAAFDLLSGNLDEAPNWMKNAGLQWLYRLWKEPKRLWRRYLVNNPLFIGLVLGQALGIRSYRIE